MTLDVTHSCIFIGTKVAGDLELLLAQLVNTRSHLSTTIMNVCTPQCTQANWDK